MKFLVILLSLVVLEPSAKAASEVAIPLNSLIGNDAAIRRVMNSLSPSEREILRNRMQAVYEEGIRTGAKRGAGIVARPVVVKPVTKKSAPAAATKKSSALSASGYLEFTNAKSANGVYTNHFLFNRHYKKSISVMVEGKRFSLAPREKILLSQDSVYAPSYSARPRSAVFND